MAVGINLALGLEGFLSLFLAGMLEVAMTVVGVACVAIEFLHGLNLLFNAAAAPALDGLFNFLLKKLLLIFFLCFLTKRAASRSFLRLLCLETSSKIEIEGFSMSLNFSMR